MLPVARAAQAHVAETLPRGVFADLPLVEQPRHVRELPQPREQPRVRPLFHRRALAAAQEKHRPLLGPPAALRQLYGALRRRPPRSRKTQRRDRAGGALRRAVRHAHRRAQLHQALREIAAAPRRVARGERPGQRRFVRGRVHGRVVVQHTRAHAQHVPVHRRRRPLKADGGDRPGGVCADAGQRKEFLDRVRKRAAAFDEDARALLQVPGAVVVPQPLPQLQQPLLRQRREREHVRRGLQKADVVVPHRLHARLLQHDLRQPHVVRLPVRAPRQLALVSRKPRQQRLDHLPQPCSVHGPSLLCFPPHYTRNPRA